MGIKNMAKNELMDQARGGGRERSGFCECRTKSEQVQELQLLMPPSKELDPK